MHVSGTANTAVSLSEEILNNNESNITYSAGGLKVKALTQTVRDVGSSPAWHSSFPHQ